MQKERCRFRISGALLTKKKSFEQLLLNKRTGENSGWMMPFLTKKKSLCSLPVIRKLDLAIVSFVMQMDYLDHCPTLDNNNIAPSYSGAGVLKGFLLKNNPLDLSSISIAHMLMLLPSSCVR
jgi:hypothetical protein